MVNDIYANIRLFANDTSLYFVVENLVMAADCPNTDLLKLSHWAAILLVLFNPTKTVSLTRHSFTSSSFYGEPKDYGGRISQTPWCYLFS